MKRLLLILFTAVATVSLRASLHQEAAADTINVEQYLAEMEKAAHAGDTEAMNYLGYLLLSGEEGVERDPAAGLLWLVKAAGEGDVKAASNLGWLYLEGGLLEKNEEEGAKWMEKAARAGLPVALSMLGDLYLEGRGVEQDTVRADSLYREAFEGGLPDAGYKLFSLKEKDYALLSPERQVEEGLYFYLRGAAGAGVKLFYLAAECDEPQALALLGDAYTRAVGVPYDYDLSLKYYLKAAMAGNPSAQFVIGELLEIFPDALDKLAEEYGPETLPDDPIYWYEKAGQQGITDADVATRRLLGLKERVSY